MQESSPEKGLGEDLSLGNQPAGRIPKPSPWDEVCSAIAAIITCMSEQWEP